MNRASVIKSDVSSKEPRHPIGYVTRQTGLTPHVIRVWERRYGAVKPHRTDTNRRLYSDDDIERLKLLKRATASGHTISRIADLPESELRPIAQSDTRAAPSGAEIEGTRDRLVERCKQSIFAMDRTGLDTALREGSVALSPPYFFEQLVAPLMQWVGDEWHAGRLGVAEEHFATASVQNALYEFCLQPSADELPAMVVCTLPGNHHEIGALLAAGAAVLEGWRPVYLGRDVPGREVVRIAGETHARAVAVSATYLSDPGILVGELQRLRKSLPNGVPILVGGDAANRSAGLLERVGVNVVRDLREFRDALGEIASAGANPG